VFPENCEGETEIAGFLSKVSLSVKPEISLQEEYFRNRGGCLVQDVAAGN